MTSTFNWTLKDGRKGRIEATYICQMTEDSINCDGYEIALKKSPSTYGSIMTLYVDGEKIETCNQPDFWQLINVPGQDGVKKIWGLKVGFVSEIAAQYEKWLAELVSGGTTDEVKIFNGQKVEEKEASEIAEIESTIEKMTAQCDPENLPTREEATRRMKKYNREENEGGEGYVSHVYCREEYSALINRLNKLKNK